MESLVKIASYINDRYQRDFGCRIDEMKLHKLLYFAQRESLVQLNEPLFAERFEAWKYGPVLVPVRHMYQYDLLHEPLSPEAVQRFTGVFDKIFSQYAVKDSWSLSTLTHGEYSWKQARLGVPEGENCSNEMKIENIKIDAQRIKMRRLMLSVLKSKK